MKKRMKRKKKNQKIYSKFIYDHFIIFLFKNSSIVNFVSTIVLDFTFCEEAENGEKKNETAT